nr:hypothetical protein CFP56_13325 [Quercus suber]
MRARMFFWRSRMRRSYEPEASTGKRPRSNHQLLSSRIASSTSATNHWFSISADDHDRSYKPVVQGHSSAIDLPEERSILGLSRLGSALTLELFTTRATAQGLPFLNRETLETPSETLRSVPSQSTRRAQTVKMSQLYGQPQLGYYSPSYAANSTHAMHYLKPHGTALASKQVSQAVQNVVRVQGQPTAPKERAQFWSRLLCGDE